MRIVLSQNARFNPYSFERMLQPYMMYTQEYNAVDEGITELKSKAELMKQYAMQEPDSKAANMYNAYANELDKQANELAKNGLKSVNRSALNNLKTMYNSSIVPIEVALNRRRELSNEQRKLAASDNTLMFDINARDLNLDDLIDNPELSYSAYSGETITNQVKSIADNLKNQLAKYKEGKPIDEFTKTFIESYGFTLDDVNAAINNPGSTEGSKILGAIVDNVIAASPIESWNNDDTLERAYKYGYQGLYNAIGKTSVSTFDDYRAKLNAQEAKEKAVYDYKKRQEALDAEDPGNPQRHYRSVSNVTVDGSKKTSQMNSDVEFLRKVAENPELLNETAKRYVGGGTSVTGATVGGYFEDYEPNYERFLNIVSRYGLTDVIDNSGPVDFNTVADLIESDIKKSALRETSYIMDVTDSTLAAETIRQNSLSRSAKGKGTGLHEYTNGKVKKKEVSIDEVTKYLGENSHIEYDPKHGIIIHGIYKGEPKSFVLDPEIVTGESIEKDGVRKNKYQAAIDAINEGIESGNDYIVEAGIDMLMNNMYYQFNSKSKVQGKTLSAKEEGGA